MTHYLLFLFVLHQSMILNPHSCEELVFSLRKDISEFRQNCPFTVVKRDNSLPIALLR